MLVGDAAGYVDALTGEGWASRWGAPSWWSAPCSTTTRRATPGSGAVCHAGIDSHVGAADSQQLAGAVHDRAGRNHFAESLQPGGQTAGAVNQPPNRARAPTKIVLPVPGEAHCSI